MTEIYKGLYQFTTVLEPIKLSMHQYLLMTNEPILVQTGSISQAQSTIPEIKKLLEGKELRYILISHFESDECGGLSLVLKECPEATAICSEVTARQKADPVPSRIKTCLCCIGSRPLHKNCIVFSKPFLRALSENLPPRTDPSIKGNTRYKRLTIQENMITLLSQSDVNNLEDIIRVAGEYGIKSIQSETPTLEDVF